MKYYDQRNNDQVDARKVKDQYEEIDTPYGKTTVEKGNYVLEYPNGDIISIHKDDFELYFAKTKNKALTETK